MTQDFEILLMFFKNKSIFFKNKFTYGDIYIMYRTL